MRRALLLPLLVAALTTPPAALAAVPLVGNPGPASVTLERLRLSVGGAFLSIDQASSVTVGPIAVAGDGTSTWPSTLLAARIDEPVSGTVSDVSYAGTMHLAIDGTSNLDVTINPARGTIDATVTVNVQATFAGSIAGSLTGSLSCSAAGPTAVALHASGYDPSTGHAELVDGALGVALTPNCTSDNMLVTLLLGTLQGAITHQIGLPASPGSSRIALDLAISPAPKAPLAAGVGSTFVLGAPIVGHSLACAARAVVGVPTAALAYAWARDGVVLAAAGATYTLAKRDAGHAISCTATASNASGAPTTSLAPPRAIPSRCIVPSVAGLTVAVASARLEQAGCVPSTRVVHAGGRKGRVVRSRPARGTRLRNGARVILDVRR